MRLSTLVDVLGVNIATKAKQTNSCMFVNQQNSPRMFKIGELPFSLKKKKMIKH